MIVSNFDGTERQKCQQQNVTTASMLAINNYAALPKKLVFWAEKSRDNSSDYLLYNSHFS
ncbi:MAG: hypothetical protein F6K24_16715 [Okeania sp. SIO2D1]|nr:hypothetical protein [Okeania sp. SIO2D1]